MLPLLVTLQYVNDGKNAVIARLSREEKGATAVEYGLIVGLIAVAIIGVLTALGGDLKDLFGRISGGVDGAGTTTTTP